MESNLNKNNGSYNNLIKYHDHIKTFIFILSFVIFIICRKNADFHFKNDLYKFNNNRINKDSHFNIISLKYFFSIRFKTIKLEYTLEILDNNKNVILPSDMVLYKSLHPLCFLEIIKENKNNIYITSIPNIYENRFFKCVEFYNINDKVNIGIKIYKENEQSEYNEEVYVINLFTEKNFYDKKIAVKNDQMFDPLTLNKQYLSLIKKMRNNKTKSIDLKKLYFRFPFCNYKRFLSTQNNVWTFRNIYNEYFCLCKGKNCMKQKIDPICKYLFYLNIVDNNKNVYKKTDFLFIDFVFSEFSSDDVLPIFKEMLNQNKPVHYITEKMDIYKEYNYNNNLPIILVNRQNYTVDGDFIEKYLTLFLKLKAVISGGGVSLNFISNIFYRIDYISYICVSHGISFFKYFLFSDFECYGRKRYNKILLPPSDKIISVAKIYGWKEDDIIKLNLPKWDKYNANYNENIVQIDNTVKIHNNSIFCMFTWRKLRRNKGISPLYFQNIFKLINDKMLKLILKQNNIILYFTLHHKLNKFKELFEFNENVQFIEENDVFECLSKTNLVISDFSSIIFDIMYRRKPYIIFIPDLYDPEIKLLYDNNYYELIESLKNGTIIFENKVSTVSQAVNKINYYIKNNFSLDSRLELFYDSFDLKVGNNTNKFISYLNKELKY